MGIAVSLLLIAFGAILTWGVNADPEGLNLDAVGVILMIVGLVGLVISMLWWRSWWGPGYFRRSAYVDDGAEPPGYGYRRGYGRRARVIEEEDAPAPAAGPPPGPPPPP
jgi:hypothetical protein